VQGLKAGTRNFDASTAGHKVLSGNHKAPPRDAVLSIGEGLRDIVSALRTETEQAKEEHLVAISKTPGNNIATPNAQLEIEKLQLEREKEKTKQQLQLQLVSLNKTH
jgi:hypothetical protein